MACHEGYDHPCGSRCIYPRCMELDHLSDPLCGVDRTQFDKPNLTCGGVGVNYTVLPGGRIRFDSN